MRVPDILKEISYHISKVGGRAVLVGGCVRDHFLGLDAKDFDIEVFGFDNIKELEDILKEFGKVKEVGKSFGILKFVVDKQEYDFAFPRVEKKVSKGHRGFDVRVDGGLEFKEAAKRRDFTINSIGFDILNREFLDPYKGIDDLKMKILRVVNEESFVEDPLRVYRGVVFASRFGLKLHKRTKELFLMMVKRGDLDELSKERVYEEFKKLLLLSKKPSVGFELLRELGVLERYFPELFALVGVKQDPKWHPEGDVWIHTMMVIDEMAKLKVGDEKEDIIMMFGALCHDFGKPSTTKLIDGRIRSLSHESAGVEPTQSFLKRLTNESRVIDEVAALVKYHLSVYQLYKDKSSLKAIRRLSTKLDLKRLEKVSRADFFGRDTKEAKSGKFEAGEWFLDMAKRLEVLDGAPKPLMKGRELLNLGLKPSPKFKKILDFLYQKQLDMEINSKEDALKYIKKEDLFNKF